MKSSYPPSNVPWGVRARRRSTIMIEMATKIAAYNYNLDIGYEAVWRMRNPAARADTPKTAPANWVPGSGPERHTFREH